MIWKLFLDDLRFPTAIMVDEGNWIVARSVAEAMSVIDGLGCPAVMSLDHDLGDGVDAPELLKQLIEEHLNGFHRHGLLAMEVRIHSANPIGSRNMRELWDNFIRIHGQEHDDKDLRAQ